MLLCACNINNINELFSIGILIFFFFFTYNEGNKYDCGQYVVSSV